MPNITADIVLQRLRAFDLNLSDCKELISYAANVPYDKLSHHFANILVDTQNLETIETKLRQNTPIAHITGRKEFFGIEFKVNEHTMIPRPETEILVEQVIDLAKKLDRPLKILDLCTGSGCILLTLLKKLPNARGTAVDISKDALAVAKWNAELLQMGNRSEFLEMDALKSLPDGDFDIITANPPYLSEEEYPNYPLLAAEPRIALVAGEGGYLFYKNILYHLSKLGNNKPYIFFEVGYSQSEKVSDIMRNYGWNVETEYDLNNTQRVVWGKFSFGGSECKNLS